LEISVKDEILKYKEYKTSLKSKTKILDIIATFVHQRKENKILPIITILSAKASGKITDTTYVAAAIIDLLYTATKIHDDVENESYSANIFNKIDALWKEKLSVLMGDYFLAQGLLLSVKNKNYQLLEIFSKSVKEITEGEIQMINNTNNLNLNKKDYLEIIQKKSATLYSACAKAGGLSTNADADTIKTLTSYGKNYGTALFIKNDLTIKNTVTNARYRITLPFILAIENSNDEEKLKMIRYLHYPVEKKTTALLQNFTEKRNGVSEAVRLMEDYKTQAIEDITELPFSTPIELLKKLVNLTV
jgi:octaprenyl-diphosphate synthase